MISQVPSQTGKSDTDLLPACQEVAVQVITRVDDCWVRLLDFKSGQVRPTDMICYLQAYALQKPHGGMCVQGSFLLSVPSQMISHCKQ